MHVGFQKSVWINGAGDDWFKRNKHELGSRDAADDAIKAIEIKPKNVLEIGCTNGWRLRKLQEQYGCAVSGIDPSEKAIEDAAKHGTHVDLGTADALPYADDSFDLVIFGFCLCFISPEDWLPMVKESNRVLKDRGHLAIYDFIGTRFVKRRMMKVMADSALEEHPVYLYNFNWPELWLSHPAYRVAIDLFDLNHAEVCTILYKNIGKLVDDDTAQVA